jgi:hypothetical protein
VGKQGKLFQKILSAGQDKSINFSDLVSLLVYLGFAERVKGEKNA